MAWTSPEASYSHTTAKGACKDSSCTVDVVLGSVTGYKDVPTDSEQALMLAVTQQPVSTAIEADQCSFQLYMSGVLCSQGTVPSVEVRLVRTSAAKPAEFQGDVSDSHHTITIHTHQLFSVEHFACAPAPTVIMKVIDIGSSVLQKRHRAFDRRETGYFYTTFPSESLLLCFSSFPFLFHDKTRTVPRLSCLFRQKL